MIDLRDNEIFAVIQEEGEDVLASDDGARAFIFVRNLPIELVAPENQDLAAEQPERVAALQALAGRLRFAALPALPREEIVGMFKDNLVPGLREERIDLVAKLKASLLAISAFENRDVFRRELRQALKANEQRVGAASIAGWLAAYDRAMGVDAVDSLKLNQFLANDDAVQKLSEADQQSLRRLFSLYEYLKLSSQTPEGLEDPVIFNVGGRLKKLNAGEWEEVKTPQNIDAVLSRVFAFFQQEQEGAEAPRAFDIIVIVQRARAMLSQTQGDRAKLKDSLLRSLEASTRPDALAALLLLAQLRQLDNLLEDPRFAKLVTDDLKKSGRDDTISGMRANPTAPMYLGRLLKVILEDRLGLSHQDAIAFGSRLSKILAIEGEKYQNIIKNNKWNL